MKIQLSSVSYLFLLLSVTLINILQWSLVDGAAVTSLQRESGESEEDTRPFCNVNEPCRYVTVSKNRSLGFNRIDTWCQCKPEQRCLKKRYDMRKRVGIHVCKKHSKKSKKVRHANRNTLAFFLRK